MRDTELFKRDLYAVAEAGRQVPGAANVGLVKWIGNPQNPIEELPPELQQYRDVIAAAESRSLKLRIARALGNLLAHHGFDLTMGDVRRLKTAHNDPRFDTYQLDIVQQVFCPANPAVATPVADDGEGSAGLTEEEWFSYV